MANEGLYFANTGEELAHLRSKVLEQEKKLERFGVERGREEVIRDSIDKFKTENLGRISEQQHQEHAVQAEDILKKETDSQLEEIIQVTEKKGVLSALSMVEKMKGWRLEDDFHNFLVGLVHQGLPPRGVKEKGPIYRALNMTLFEVVLPDTAGNEDKKDLKTLISSMEQFYAGMLSVSEEKTQGKNYFVLEIANSNTSEEFIFYVSVPTEKKTLFEKHLLSVFPSANLIEREKDYNIFSDDAYSLASLAALAAPSALPLKTYETFDYDPLNTILNSFSKVPKDGSGVAIQVIFNPQGDLYTKKYVSAQKKIEKGENAREAIDETSTMGEIVNSVGKLFFSSKKKEGKPKEIDTTTLEHIKTKLLSPTIAVNLRIAVSGRTAPEAEHILSEIESSFNQFESPGVNRIVWRRVAPRRLADFFRNFSFRLYSPDEVLPLNLRELTTIFHFHTEALSGRSELKQVKAGDAPVPFGLSQEGTLLGVNRYHNTETKVFIADEDRLRHVYAIGQTGTGKSTLLKNMIIQDIERGNGVCMIDPHGSDILDVLAHVPPERRDDVIYFDPSYAPRPMGLNMLEYDRNRPEQKTFVVNELFSIFQKLYGGVPESMGPMFEQYFRNATMLVIEDPDSGSTLLDVSRVMSNKEYRMLKLSRCKNPVVVQFWKEIAEKAGGEASLVNIVPYITSKFDVFLANDIMRPIIAQEKSAFNFRDIMDNKKILLVNLAKGRLGDINANLIGLIIVGKILMAALSRVDTVGQNKESTNIPPFYLYIDEFQNITTPSIATILSEARKYKLSLFMAHQFIAQLSDDTKNAVFGNVGNMVVYRVGADDAEYLVKQFEPVFNISQIMNIDNHNAYIKMLIHGKPSKPFNIRAMPPPPPTDINIQAIQELSHLKYGRDKDEVEAEIMEKYSPRFGEASEKPAPVFRTG